MPLSRRSTLPWLSCLVGTALLGACTPEASTDAEGPAANSVQAALTPLPNYALGKPTTQSSVYPGGGGARAVDGNTHGDYGAGSVTHTEFQPQPWWQVDLQNEYALGEVVLFNRTDCCSDRLRDFRVSVSKDGITWQDFKYPGIAKEKTPIDVGRSSARYVRVQLNGTDALSLAEVQVFPPASNVARGKPTTQSSIYPGGGGGARAVDGITHGDHGAGSVTHTQFDFQPWWQVDLQDLYDVSDVVLYNRTDCCADRLRDFRVRVSTDGITWEDFKYPGVAPVQSIHRVNRPARYVRVQLNGTDALSLAEVQVFGTARSGAAGNIVYGHWSSSGGRSHKDPGNRRLLLDVTAKSEVSLQLTSVADAYLYLLDGNDNLLAEDDNSGGGSHARITRELSAGTYKVVAATAVDGKQAEFTLDANRAVLRFPQRLRVQAATRFEWIYDDYKTHARDSVSVWRADLSEHPGYYSLGDVAMPSHGEAPRLTFLVSGEGDLLEKPVGYHRIWGDWGSGGAHDVSFWEPVAPAGYTCLGSITVLNYDEPSTDLMRCVKSEYVLPGNASYVWNDKGSHANGDVAVWQAEPRDYRGLSLSTFKSQDHYGDPDSGRFWVLNKSATANPELMGLPVDSQTALQFAPRVWLHGEESYFPSSVEHFLDNVHEEDGHLVTNQGLGCNSCTDPAFLDGVRPDQHHVPMYVEIVHRTENGLPTNVTDLIYWTFYPYNNGKRVCIGDYGPLGCFGGYSTFGNHVGDWEHVTVRFKDNRPDAVYLSQHADGETFGYGAKWLGLVDFHPEVYAAHGSHGLYRDAARHIYKRLPNRDFLADDTDRGIAWDGWVQPVIFPWQPMGTYTGSLEWLNITADWGNPKAGCGISEPISGACVLNGGPTAPMKKGFSQPGHMPLE